MNKLYGNCANVLDFGARPNSFEDDTEAFIAAIATGYTVVVPAGIYYINQTLKIENQNLIGSGSFQTHIVSINQNAKEPILMAGRSCKVSDLLLMYKYGLVTGNEKEGERVGILMHGENWPLQRGSSIRNVRIENVGTCLHMPKDYPKGGPFSVEHANLELQNFSFRAIDYGTSHRIGNIFSNIFICSDKRTVDCLINLEKDASNISMIQIVMINTRCRRAALSLSNVHGFNITSVHFGGINLVEDGHGIIEIENSSGEIGELHCNYIPIECKNLSLIKLYNSEYDLCITPKEIKDTEHYIRINNFDVCGINDPVQDQRTVGIEYNGLTEDFKFIAREEDSRGKYTVEIGNYSYYTFKNDTEEYEKFCCDDDRIIFLKKGNIALGGGSGERPKYRLCKYVSEYLDTDIGKKVYWDGEKWV